MEEVDPRNFSVSPSTILAVYRNHLLSKSDAAIQIACTLGGIWKLACLLKVIPAIVRDAVYNWVARNRIRWFGPADRCELPSSAPDARQTDFINRLG